SYLGFGLATDLFYPELYDPDSAVRFALLRQRIAEAPDRPLLLVVGSSRTGTAFRPEILAPLDTGNGPAPLVFNFSHWGANAAFNLMQVKRLLREGIRPDWLVVELMPPWLSREDKLAGSV